MPMPIQPEVITTFTGGGTMLGVIFYLMQAHVKANERADKAQEKAEARYEAELARERAKNEQLSVEKEELRRQNEEKQRRLDRIANPGDTRFAERQAAQAQQQGDQQ